MKFKVNFSDVQDFEPMPAGIYHVEVVDVKLKESQSSDYPYLNWEFVVLEEGYSNRKLWTITSLSPKAAFKMKEALIAFGESKEALTDDFELDPETYIGRRCLAAVVQDTYQGKINNKIESLEFDNQAKVKAGGMKIR